MSVESRAMDGTGDSAATAIAAVKPCAFGAPLRGCDFLPIVKEKSEARR